MIRSLAHVCISSIDLAATEQFYCDVLGMEKQFNFIFEGHKVGFYLKVSETNYIEVFEQDSIDHDAPVAIRHLCFETKDIDTVATALTAAGVSVTDKKMGSDNSWQIWTADPSGVKIEFHEYTPESSQMTGADCILK